jgi:NAD+-dependent protein deacetylase sirtuin 4
MSPGRMDAPDAFDALVGLLRGRAAVALTGAGCSTRSGIPDYRGPTAPARRRPPIQYAELVGDPTARQRYWARAVVGWPRFRAARPNAAHEALARLETAGHVLGTITQNVDRLHDVAGSRNLIELHGTLHRARCLACHTLEDRDALQMRLLELNPSFLDIEVASAPDGDAELPDAMVAGFRVPSCRACGGLLKPDVVFFGETVPRPTVETARALVHRAEALLVLGSSLTVLSGLRFVREAARLDLPIAIVNLGPTRGDPLATLRLHADVCETLPRLAAAFGAPHAHPPRARA